MISRLCLCPVSQISTPVSDRVRSLLYLYLSPRPLPVSSTKSLATSLPSSALFSHRVFSFVPNSRCINGRFGFFIILIIQPFSTPCLFCFLTARLLHGFGVQAGVMLPMTRPRAS